MMRHRSHTSYSSAPQSSRAHGCPFLVRRLDFTGVSEVMLLLDTLDASEGGYGGAPYSNWLRLGCPPGGFTARCGCNSTAGQVSTSHSSQASV